MITLVQRKDIYLFDSDCLDCHGLFLYISLQQPINLLKMNPNNIEKKNKDNYCIVYDNVIKSENYQSQPVDKSTLYALTQTLAFILTDQVT